MKVLQEYNHKIFFYSFVAFIVFYSLKMLQPFFSMAALAFVLSLLTYPIYKWFFTISKGRRLLSSLFTLVVFVILLFIPMVIIGNMLINQTNELAVDVKEYVTNNHITYFSFIDSVNEKLARLPNVDIQISNEEIDNLIISLIDGLKTWLSSNIASIGSNLISTVSSFLIFIIFYITFIPNPQNIISAIKKLSPLSDEIDNMYLSRVIATSESMVQGIFLIALAQASLSGLVLWAVGVKYVAFWTIIMIFMGVIPMLGHAIITVPIAIYMILSGNIVAGVIILIAAVVISQVDNIMRIGLVPKSAKLHPVLTFIALLGGAQLFGLMGFLYGPVLMILLVTSIEIYSKYYTK